MIVAFFDFDGTITQRDTFLDFVVFTHGRKNMMKGILRHFFSALGYKLGLVSGHLIKEKLLTHFYQGFSVVDMVALGNTYCATQLPLALREKALERIHWHKAQGHKVVVVTASVRYWVAPWCEGLGIDLIATQLAITDGVFTGKLSGENCIGKEKVNRIQKQFDAAAISYSYGYGNSRGDRELLAMVNESYYQCF